MTALTQYAEPRARSSSPARRRTVRAIGPLQVRLGFRNSFDALSCAELRTAAEAARSLARGRGVSHVHIDLDDVTALDDRALESLNQAWELFTRRGWSVTVTVPQAPDAGLHFVRAAIAGRLAWAKGSAPRTAAQGATQEALA